MKKRLKAKWVKALRSGKYQQIEGRLSDGKGFCCLGVLCDISGKGNWNAAKGFTYEIGAEAGCMGLPEPLQEEAGLSTVDAGKLWRMNDGIAGNRKHTFSEIADHIEKTL